MVASPPGWLGWEGSSLTLQKLGSCYMEWSVTPRIDPNFVVLEPYYSCIVWQSAGTGSPFQPIFSEIMVSGVPVQAARARTVEDAQLEQIKLGRKSQQVQL